LLQATKIYLAT